MTRSPAALGIIASIFLSTQAIAIGINLRVSTGDLQSGDALTTLTFNNQFEDADATAAATRGTVALVYAGGDAGGGVGMRYTLSATPSGGSAPYSVRATTSQGPVGSATAGCNGPQGQFCHNNSSVGVIMFAATYVAGSCPSDSASWGSQSTVAAGSNSGSLGAPSSGFAICCVAAIDVITGSTTSTPSDANRTGIVSIATCP